MGLSKRLIARLDIKGNKLIKGVRFEGLRVLGDPVEAASQYARDGIDEMLLIDAVASLYGRNSLTDILRETTREVFVPITAGGGIRTVEDAAKLLASGADKIAVNTEALKRPELITELANEFGSQCVVVSIQARKVNPLKWEAMGEAGRERTRKNVFNWIEEVQERGAGEILLTSIDQDGTCQGPDNELISESIKYVSIPLVVSGGFSTEKDIRQTFLNDSIGGIAIGTAFHKRKLIIKTCKDGLNTAALPIRTIQSQSLLIKKPLKGHRIGVVDYGMGNQQSLINALEYLGSEINLSNRWEELKTSEAIMLPGVGAFPEGMKRLQERNLISPLIKWGEEGKPLVGICLGMQMLFQESEEFELCRGLGLLNGKVVRIDSVSQFDRRYCLPHMGWNLVNHSSSEEKNDSTYQYFVHSFIATGVRPSNELYKSRYGGIEFCSAVRLGSIVGFQFHPERSGNEGLQILSNICSQIINNQ